MMSFIFRRIVFGSASFSTARPCSWKVLVGKCSVSTKKVADKLCFIKALCLWTQKLECFDKWQEVQRALIWVFGISTDILLAMQPLGAESHMSCEEWI